MDISPKIKVSVIVPIYNTIAYLDKCVQSLISQSLHDMEIILVDDGSEDGSAQRCDEYASKYNNIQVIHKVNAGLGYARNSGLKIAKGEYIGFVDSDDFVSPNMFELLYNNAKEGFADVSYGSYMRFIQEENIEKYSQKQINNITFWNESDMKYYLLNRIGLPPEYNNDTLYEPIVCNGIFKTSIFKDNEIYFVSEREIISEDIIFDIDYLMKCKSVVHSSDIVYYYRYNPKSLTTSYKRNRFQKNVDLYFLMKDKLMAAYTEDEIRNCLSRYFLTFTRVAIMQEAIHLKKNGLHHAVIMVKAICQNPVLKNILLDYDYKKLPIKYRTFCTFEKRGNICMLIILAYISQVVKGKIKRRKV